jgi:uncharacterized protein
MTSAASRFVPYASDPDTAGFFAFAKQGQLALRFCVSCGRALHLPRAYCSLCGSWEGEWRPITGEGSLHSWTRVEHSLHPAYPAPYTIVLVDVEGPARLVGYLPGAPELSAGQRFRVWFDDIGNGVIIPQWAPTDAPDL